MNVECKVKNRNLIIQMQGELDDHNAKIVRDKIDRLIDRNNILNIIFDFSYMDFMDSSGIGIIMGRYKKIQTFGGVIAVVNVKPTIDRIFNLSGLYKIVKKYNDVNEIFNTL